MRVELNNLYHARNDDGSRVLIPLGMAGEMDGFVPTQKGQHLLAVVTWDRVFVGKFDAETQVWDAEEREDVEVLVPAEDVESIG